MNGESTPDIQRGGGVGFELLEGPDDVSVIAIGSAIREIDRLRKLYGAGRWRKLKGKARIRLDDNSVWMAELHWYEAHGIGKRGLKIKYLLEEVYEP